MIKMTWALAALIALTATAIITAFSASNSNSTTRKRDITLQNVAWTYVGFFTLTAAIWGIARILYDLSMHGHGYGDGDIF